MKILMTEPMTVLEDQHIATLVPDEVFTLVHQDLFPSLFVDLMFNKKKVNRCLARYSPRATTTNRPINRAMNKPGPN